MKFSTIAFLFTLTLLIGCNGGGGGGNPITNDDSPTSISCPDNFIPVPHKTELGTTKDFCVMKYEAKNNGSGVAVSQAQGNPYGNLTMEEAYAKCTDLNALNNVTDKYDLISNQEWMTIARNAESVSSNSEAGVMSRGWSASTSYNPADQWTNTAVAPSTDENCLYNTGANTCGPSGDHLFKRTLTLSNGEEIWDLSGNVWEWVDWDVLTPGLQTAPLNTCQTGFVEFSTFISDSCFTGGELSANEVLPATNNVNSEDGFGRIYPYSDGTQVCRGGFFSKDGMGAATIGGAFALSLGLCNTNGSGDARGFRCVYRP